MIKCIQILALSFLMVVMGTKASMAFFLLPEIHHSAHVNNPGGENFPTGYFPSLNGFLSGTAFHQGEGIAYQFSLDREYHVYSLEGWMGILNDDNNLIETAHHDLIVYKGSSILAPYYNLNDPVPSEKIVFKKGFDVIENTNYLDPEGPEVRFEWHGVSKQNTKLGSGDYWLAFENGGLTRIEPGIRLGVVPTPEPATIFLLGSGLAGVFLRRRKNDSRVK